MNKKISILIPAYNEGAIIYKSLQLVTEFMKTQPYDYEIIVSDDGSWDNTCVESKKASQVFGKIKVLPHQKNKGKGDALKNAFFDSNGEWIVFLDADLDIPPSQLSLFFHLMESNAPDIIIGCKRHPESIINYPLKRKILSWGYSSILKILFGLPVRDTQTGMKLFKRKVLEDIFPIILCKRFAYDIEILACAHKLGYTISEAPIIIHYDMGKWGRIGIRTTRQIMTDTCAIFYRMYILRWYQKKFESLHASLSLEKTNG